MVSNTKYMSIENHNPTKPIIWILIWLVIAVLFALTDNNTNAGQRLSLDR